MDEAERREAARRRRAQTEKDTALFGRAEAWVRDQFITTDEEVGVDQGWRLLTFDALLATYMAAIQARTDLPDPIRAPEFFDRCVDDFAILVGPMRRATDAAIGSGELLLDGIGTHDPSTRRTIPVAELPAFDSIDFARRELRNDRITYRDLRVRRATPMSLDSAASPSEASTEPKKLKPLPGNEQVINELLSDACEENWGMGQEAIPGEKERNRVLRNWLEVKGYRFNRELIRPFFRRPEIQDRLQKRGRRPSPLNVRNKCAR